MKGMIKLILIIGIISTIIYMIYVVADGYRYFADINDLIAKYPSVPKPARKVVIVIPCGNEEICVNTIKSLLSQSVGVNDIGIESNKYSVPDEIKEVVTLHRPDTVLLRETENDTVIINAENGKWYDYDFVENYLNR